MYAGRRFFHPEDKKITHLLEDVLHFITHFDNVFFKTIKTIFSRPGLYSLHYCNGIRKKYFRPVSLFLLCVVLYLLFPFFNGLNMRLRTYVSRDYDYAWYGRPLVRAKMVHAHLDLQQLAARYDSESPHFSKLFLLTLLPFTAFILAGLFFRRKKAFFDHFIMATEFNTFMVVFAYLLVPLLDKIMNGISLLLFKNDFLASEFLIGLVDLAAFLVFGLIAFRRFYGEKWGTTIFKTLLFIFLYSWIAVGLYKIIVLVCVLWFI